MSRRRWGAPYWLFFSFLLRGGSLLAQGGSATRVVDEFLTLSADWVAGEEYIVISPGELQNTDRDESWHHLAVYRGLQNVQSVALVWGRNVPGSNSGSGAAALALGLDAASSSANGYAVVKREEGLQLYQIVGGTLGLLLDEVPHPVHLDLPAAGDTTRVVFRAERDAFYFDVYVNGEYDGTLKDPLKTIPVASPYYAGLILHGLPEAINNVTAAVLVRYDDILPPTRITDLEVQPESPFSARLHWSAPAERGGTNSRAYRYDVRYSTTPIDPQTFESAPRALGAADLVPGEAGSDQEFVVYGLAPGGTYYFAIRSEDAAGNASEISFSGAVTLPPRPDRLIFVEDFSGSELGGNWAGSQGMIVEAGELRNGTPARSLATWLAEANPRRVGLRWGNSVTAEGVSTGGLALMLDAPSVSANGYLLLHQGESVKLLPISEGNVVDQTLASGPSLSGLPMGPGDLLEVEILDDKDGTHFLVYRNGVFDALVHEPQGARPPASRYYGGVLLAPGAEGAVTEFIAEVSTAEAAYLEIVQGDRQSGPVTSSLPIPLIVRLVGTDGAPVPGAVVDFRVTDGAAVLSVDSLALDGHYYLEAEEAKTRGAVQVVDDPQASGGKAALSRGETRCYVEFPLYVALAGEHRVWLRYLAPDDNSNRLSGFQVDEGDTVRHNGDDWILPTTADYVWTQPAGLSLYLGRGAHTLRVFFASPGFYLDKILLSRDPEYEPQGLGDPPVALTNLTDAEGLAWTRLTLGTVAGPVVIEAAVRGLPAIRFTEVAEPGPPQRLEMVRGDGQQGTVGSALPESLAVRVTDAYGNPIAGHRVNFWIHSGGGSLNGVGRSADVSTNEAGIGAVQLVLSTAVGNVQVRAQSFRDSDPLEGSPVTFVVQALPDVPFRLLVYSGEDQTGPAGAELPEPLAVQVQDRYGNPCPGHLVRFEVVAGGGNLEGQQSIEVTTDDQGLARARLTLGPQAGVVNRVRVSCVYQGSPLTGSPAFFEARSYTGAAARLAYVAGDSQRTTVGTHLPDPLVVQVTDPFGNPVQGFEVRFEVREGEGQLDSALAVTDSLGIARTGLTVGRVAGVWNQLVWATASQGGAPLVGSPVVFRATALPDVPSRLVKVSGDGQSGLVGGVLPLPLRVRVLDRYGNPVPGCPVLFEVIDGGGKVNGAESAEVNTAADGVAQVIWTLGPTLGPQSNRVRAHARHGGLEIDGSPVEFVASSTPREPSRLVEISGNRQVGRAGTDLEQPFVACVTDELGNPISGYLVTLRVVAGGGNIGGVTELDLATNAQGLVQATLTLGTAAGAENNVVEIIAPNLLGSPLRFVASALPNDPHQLTKVSGDGQTAPAGTPLPLPLVVKVQDRYGNPVPGHPVTFVVVAGAGSFAGEPSLQVVTDDSGRAAATYTVGPQPGVGNNVVEARSTFGGQALVGSPVRFTSSAVLGPPSRLTYVSGDSQVGVVNSPLLYPFKVRVTDAAGNAIEGHPVEFRVLSGGGTLDGTGQTVLIRTTNRDGICQVRLTLGGTPGVNNHVVQARSTHNGVDLAGSPLLFRASARSSEAVRLVYVAGSGQEGTVGKPLPQPLRVRVTDTYGNGVPGHPVTFRVVAGGGKLNGGSDTLLVRSTDAAGYADCVLILGTRAGVGLHRVEASSNNGIGPLEGSPVVFTASAVPDLPDPDSSRVWTDRGTAPADGQTSVGLFARLVDRYGNPTPGKVVTFEAIGTGHQIQQPASASDLQGMVRGSIVSTQAGTKTIRARVVTDQIDLRNSATVTFTSLAAARIVLFSGNDQTRNAGTILAESLAVRIEDRYGNPVAGYPVTFAVTKGTGKILEAQPVASNAAGIAAVHYILSRTEGTDFVEARAEGLAGSPVLFRLNAVTGVPAVAELVSGNGQTGTVDQWLPELLRVRVKDGRGDPVWGAVVRFSAPTGGEVYPTADSTDAWGIAEVHFRLGRQKGTYQVLAEASGVSAKIQFSFVASPAQAARLVAVSGAEQVGTVGLTLPQPLSVRVEDRYGNGIAGVPVAFSVVSGGGQLSVSSVRLTDGQGLASTVWTLGTRAGQQVAKAEVAGLEGSPLFFTATARPGTPDSLAAYGGANQRGQAGRELGLPIEVIVLDRYGNGVPGTGVTFVTVDGKSRIVESEPVITDERGVAGAHWILADQPGTNVAWAIRLGLRGSPVEFRAWGEASLYPVILAPGDTSVSEGQRIEFTVSAYDPDGGTVSLGASNLPRGAQFDSLRTGRFSWSPDRSAAGIYRLLFRARDDEGCVSHKITTLRVLDQNRAPEIISFTPSSRTVAITYPDSLLFSVVARDPDSDSLSFRWYVHRGSGRTLVSTGPSYRFLSTRHDPGDLTVRVTVYDRSDSASMSWQITVHTAVQLESFAAQVLPFEGVRLLWKTAREVGTLGFNILRSEQEDGTYRALNAELISSRNDRTYQYLDRTASAGKVYYYRLEDVDLSGRRTLHEPVRVSVGLPERLVLHPNYPNPFNPATRLRLEVPRATRVRIEVFDVRGRLVRVLADQLLEAGYREFLWDGRDDHGLEVPSGVYYCRAVCGAEVLTRKMLLLR
ncbi:MAG: Ig-like domain-containing protein [candidate division KSB1 bacterium]|nr:Ig-like domain-containing protein [candidate division KSB1 bacterium]